MPNYELVNPYIIGGMKNSFSATDSKSAADNAWSSLSQYITNNVPKFAFTLRNINDGKLSHFLVKEKLNKDKSVDYSIKELKLKLNKEQENYITKNIERIQNGGKKKDDSESDSSDSSSDSSDDSDSDDIYKKIRYFKNKNQPLNYLWYSPLIYNKDGKVESV